MTNVGKLYYKGAKRLSMGLIPWVSGATTLYMALYDSNLTPVQATEETYDTTHELPTANGYTQGGIALTSVVDPVISGSNVILASANAEWASPCTFTTARCAKIYNNTGSKYLLGYILWDADKPSVGGRFLVDCPAVGWFEWTVP
jgi:hypothetical protein